MRCRADWTPVGGWRGVQIGGVGRIGRQWAVGAASRLGVYGGLDASGRFARRPDLGVYGGLDASGRLAWRPDCVYRVIWTPIVNNRGVQILGGC